MKTVLTENQKSLLHELLQWVQSDENKCIIESSGDRYFVFEHENIYDGKSLSFYTQETFTVRRVITMLEMILNTGAYFSNEKFYLNKLREMYIGRGDVSLASTDQRDLLENLLK